MYAVPSGVTWCYTVLHCVTRMLQDIQLHCNMLYRVTPKIFKFSLRAVAFQSKDIITEPHFHVWKYVFQRINIRPFRIIWSKTKKSSVLGTCCSMSQRQVHTCWERTQRKVISFDFRLYCSISPRQSSKDSIKNKDFA